MKNRIKNIIIANDTEAFSSIINSIEDKAQRISKIRKEHFLSSRFLFWEGDNKIVITPFPVDKSIILYAKSLGYENIVNLFPENMDINLSDAIINDSCLMDRIVSIIRDNPKIIISSYCFTESFSKLINILRGQKLLFKVDQEPLNNAQWLVDYLGSKVGFRVETKDLSIPVPEFFICRGKKEVLDTVVWMYKKNKSSIIKVYSGEGGWGVYMVHRDEYSSEEELISKIKSILNSDSIWNFYPFVVEEFIPSSNNDQSSPSLEIFIDDKCSKITYVCNQIVDKFGCFLGIVIGKNCVKTSIDKQIRKIGNAIGQRYFKLGYRGFLDVDFIMSKKGITFPIETNVRRTGGTHVYDLTRHVFGDRWFSKTIALSSDSFCYGEKILSAENIFNKIKQILFPINGKKEGVVLVAVDSYHCIFSCVIFGKTKQRVLDIHEKLTHIFKQDNIKK
ncbi:MAG: hypothetical protein WCO84_02000 [bacterium]